MRFALMLVAMALLGIVGAHPSDAASGSKFRDCPECPEMIVVPAGSFMMGSPATEPSRSEHEGPQHRVNIGRFAVGIFDVTRGEYAAFARDTHRTAITGCIVWNGKSLTGPEKAFADDKSSDWQNPGFPQTDRDPVVCVNWNDAQAYIGWLNQKVRAEQNVIAPSNEHGPYRLLTEAEWEYAARAGTSTPYYWGERANHDMANYGAEKCPPCDALVQGKDRWRYTSPVGSFAANAFGLYDMSGNVWQVLQDCWHPDFKGAPSEGAEWIGGDCNIRVFRGGCWIDSPDILRIAYRSDDGRATDRDGFTGFRVARTLK